jgi:RNA polymerase sigma-70 factor (ECF subfamily)
VDYDTTAEAAHASLEARRVRQAMSSLTAAQRQALELAYFNGYTHTEVATMLDLPLGTAKTRIRDGLIRLRDMMGVGQ